MQGQGAGDVQRVAADVVAGAHMHRPHAEMRQRPVGAQGPGAGAAAAARPLGGMQSSRQHVPASCHRERVRSVQAGTLPMLHILKRDIAKHSSHGRAPEGGHAGHAEPGAAPSVAARAASLGAGAPLAQHGNAGGRAAAPELHGKPRLMHFLCCPSSVQIYRTTGEGWTICLQQDTCTCDACFLCPTKAPL